MNGHSVSRASLSHEEKLALLEELSNASDVDSEGGRADLAARFRRFAIAHPCPSELQATVPRLASKLRATVPHLVRHAPAVARNAVRALLSIPWGLLLFRFLIFLVPSFLQGAITGESRAGQARLMPTAYLDGMRGLAALFVYFCHYSYQAFVIAQGWGSRETNYHFLKLPFFRIWYQGPPMVCVFFVISGYALSLRPVKLMRSCSWAELEGTLSSTVFRRGIRLFVPTAISTLFIVFLLRIGAYEHTRAFGNDRTYMKNVVEPHADLLESTRAQVASWAWDMFRFVHVFGWDTYGGSTTLDVHLWTIPVEFRCSMYLFLVLIGTARLRPWIRSVVLMAVIWFSYRNSHWELCLFYCGMMIAELDLMRGAHSAGGQSPLPLDEKTPQPGSWLSRNIRGIFWFGLSMGALYLMNQPDDLAEVTPGWVYLSSLIPAWWHEPRYRYWQSIGSALFVWTVGHSACWQRFFNHPVVQYFGKISYALYLMHGPVMHTAGYVIERWAYGITGVEGWWYNAGFFLGAAFAVPTVVWAADIFWRAVDVPTVKFAKWAESKCLVKQA